MFACESSSLDDTRAFGKDFAKKIKPGSLVAFFGELGAGKTTLIKSIANHFGASQDDVNSPTYVYVQTYETTPKIHHFDLYRLKNKNDFISMGFEEYFEEESICLIEWPERISSLLPKNTIQVHLDVVDQKRRKISWKS